LLVLQVTAKSNMKISCTKLPSEWWPDFYYLLKATNDAGKLEIAQIKPTLESVAMFIKEAKKVFPNEDYEGVQFDTFFRSKAYYES